MTYLPENVLFDGSTNSMSRGADLTGNADSKLGLVSFWFKIEGGDGLQLQVIGQSGFDFQVYRHTDGRILSFGRDVANTSALIIYTTSTFAAGEGWHHYLSSWDLGSATRHIYVDDAVDEGATTVLDLALDYTGTDWFLGASVAAANKFNGALADLYFTNEYLDLSIEANRRKFLTASGSPVDLGSDGSLPTGTAPLIYMKQGGTTSLGVNAGTGGNFTAGGSYTATLGPPDKRVEANPWVFVHADHYEGQANAAETPAPNFNLPFYIKHFVVYGGASGGTVTIDNDGSATRSIVPATEVVANTVTVIPIEDYTDGVYITTLDAGITVHCFHGEDIDEEDF